MSNPMSYEGRNVVVTGAYSGVGAALVELLARFGGGVDHRAGHQRA